MSLSFRIFTLFFFLIFSLSATAKPYFDATSIPANLLKPPYEKGSSQWKKEVKEIIALQKNASDVEVKKANSERDLKPEMMLEEYPEITRESNPALYKLLDRTSETSLAVTDQAKNFWHTRRPYLSDKKIKAVIKAHDNPSYPSGHTSGSYTWAYVLTMLMPDEKEHLFTHAESIAQHRILVGMHYPHDIAGGKQLAQLIVGGLLQNKDFQHDLAKAKNELNLDKKQSR